VNKLTAILLILAPSALYAQPGTATDFRATIRGGGGNGKCTIEVEVDGVAEIEVRGDLGRMRTIAGSPAVWRRFECNQIMPLNPSGFRFRGIDGRGRQDLVRSPGGRLGPVVRIDDPKGGREGYTFDLEWTGGTGTSESGWTEPAAGAGWGGIRSGPRNSGSGWGSSGSTGRRSGSGWGGSDSGWAGSNWGNGTGELRYSGNGTGQFSNANGYRDDIRSCRVQIDRNGNAEVVFRTAREGTVTLRGRVERVNGNRIIANMAGNGVSGQMSILTQGSDRVTQVRMAGTDPVRFELSWRD